MIFLALCRFWSGDLSHHKQALLSTEPRCFSPTEPQCLSDSKNQILKITPQEITEYTLTFVIFTQRLLAAKYLHCSYTNLGCFPYTRATSNYILNNEAIITRRKDTLYHLLSPIILCFFTTYHHGFVLLYCYQLTRQRWLKEKINKIFENNELKFFTCV